MKKAKYLCSIMNNTLYHVINLSLKNNEHLFVKIVDRKVTSAFLFIN